MKASRLVALTLAATGFAANAAGVVLDVSAGRSLDGWQLTSAGVGVPAGLLGLLVAWHQPKNRIAWIFLAAAVGFGLDQLALGALSDPAVPAAAQAVSYIVLSLVAGPLTAVWVLLILLFPDGRFQRRLWAGYGIAAVALATVASLAEMLLAPAGHLPQEYGTSAPLWLHGPLAVTSGWAPLVQGLDVPGMLLPAIALVALADRYRHCSTTVRQQIKWLLLAGALEVGIQLAFLPLGRAGVVEPAALSLLVAPLPTLGAGLAIFRYRLWEIDRLVSRTVAFAALWLATTAAFLALAAAVGLAAGGAGPRLLAAVAPALLVAMLLQPLRSRLELAINRLVYGPHPRGYAALARLDSPAAGLRPVDELADLIATMALEAAALRWASVWLRIESDGRSLLRRAGGAGDEPAGSDGVVMELRGDRAGPPSPAAMLGEPDGAVIAMESGADEVGVLVCGPGLRGELSADGRGLLASVARQGAVLLRSGRLERELEHRLAELQESRQRLVTAQDEQRRRLERDLHDGVQQQLVSLAAKLRRLARAGARPGELDALADEAEDAVFSLQDLARGIYPSVLVDQGLVAGLRAAAARLPLDVRVEVDPALAERRLPAEAEACLYFVAMEAIANAQKHSGSSEVIVAIRSGEASRSVVLEVHDRGRGLPPTAASRGTGFLNMRDRLSALGGRLAVRSEPGSGTWVVASLPQRADVVPLQRPGALSLR